MKKKNYKLKIEENTSLISEVGPSQYGSAGMQAAGQLIKTSSEAIKMTGSFLKRNWNATFGYAFNIFKEIRKHGIIRGLLSASRIMHSKDKQIKREMKSLISAQPGTKDAELFMGMSCPAARAFDVFVDKEFFDLDITPGRKGDRARDRIKYKALYNFAMAISYVSDKTSLDLYTQNNKKLNRDQREKGLKKKYKVDSTAYKNFGNEEFLNVCKALANFYRLDKDLNKLFKENGLTYIPINKQQKMFIDNVIKIKDPKKCLSFISEYELEHTVVDLAAIIVEDDSVKCLNLVLKQTKNESFTKTGRIVLKENKIILLEDVEEEINKNEIPDPTYNLQSSMALSFTTFFMMRSSIVSKMVEIKINLILSIIKLFDGMLTSVISENKEFNINNIEITEASSIGNSIEKTNKQIEVFNKQFDFNIDLIKNDIIKDLNNFTVKIKKDMSDSNQKFLQDIKSPEERKLIRAECLIDLLNQVKLNFGDISFSKDFEAEMTTIAKLILEDLKSAKEIESLMSKEKGKLIQAGISNNLPQEINERVKSIQAKVKTTNSIELKIKNYTEKTEQLKSLIEKESDDQVSDKENTETVEISADVMEK